MTVYVLLSTTFILSLPIIIVYCIIVHHVWMMNHFMFSSLTCLLFCILTPPGNRLPMWHAPSPAVTGPRPGHHERTRVVVFLQGGLVLCGDRAVHLLPSSGHYLLISKSAGNRPLPMWTAGGPRWPGGGHPAPYLHYQHQPANGARERRTQCKCYNLTRSTGEFTVDRCCWSVSTSCLTWTFIGFLPFGCS